MTAVNSEFMIITIILGSSLCVSLILTSVLLRNPRLNVMDIPNKRSLHVTPRPRGGGLAILAGISVGVALAVLFGVERNPLLWIVLGTLIIAAVSFTDDRRGVPVMVRLLIHSGASIPIVMSGLTFSSLQFPAFELHIVGWAAGFFAFVFLVWMTNLYNFMDGMDGFAAGMAVIGFGAYAIMGVLSGHAFFAITNTSIAAAAAGFLLFNFPPARIFMGDVGSSSLGFLAGTVTLWANKEGIFPLWIGILVFSPFILDATVTLIRRMARREKIWVPHKTHYYQRIVALGWGHRKTVLAEYALMLACAISGITAVVYLSHFGQWVLIVFWVMIYVSIMATVDRFENAQIITRHG